MMVKELDRCERCGQEREGKRAEWIEMDPGNRERKESVPGKLMGEDGRVEFLPRLPRDELRLTSEF